MTEALEKTVIQESALSLRDITDRVKLVHQVFTKVMKDGCHYGTVPGCGNKKVLLKPGADVLAMTFQLVPQFSVSRNDLSNGHREYDVVCSMYSARGILLGQGVGNASTMEKKYRYRKDKSDAVIENEDIADVYNTVLKIAKKRAQVDATLTVTGAADIFTQDIAGPEEGEDKPAPPPITEPQARQQDAGSTPSAGTQTVTGIIANVSAKPTARGGKRYGVQVGANWYNTFDDKLGEMAEALKGVSVHVTYTVNNKGYNDITDMMPAAQQQQ